MQASLLAGLYRNNGKPVYQDETNLLENQFIKCEVMRPLFDEVSSKILALFPGTQLTLQKKRTCLIQPRENLQR